MPGGDPLATLESARRVTENIGATFNRNAVTRRVLYPAIKRANVLLEAQKLAPIPAGVTFHSLRRTFASIAAEAGADPAWTTAQIGHADASFTLNVYTDVSNRRGSHAARIGRLVRGESNGTGAISAAETGATPAEPTPTGAPHRSA